MTNNISTAKFDMASPDLVAKNIEQIASIFPACIVESAEGKKIDFDLLRQELSHDIVEGPKERYRLEWPGKREAIVTANLPTNKTLRPIPEDSVNFDKTENLYIEGDNLEVLKLLQESYLGKIKLIYIDPPYNTGNDFVYRDNFDIDTALFNELSGQINEYKQRLVPNPESSGRYHSVWLTMIYPRLKLARNLLADDGVIVISIDDAEQGNLKKLCDEIFGEINLLGTLVWDKNRKNDAKYFSVGHEYMFVYAKSKQYLKEQKIVFREHKEGIEEAKIFYNSLKSQFGVDVESIEKAWRQFFNKLEKEDPRKPLGRFSKIGSNGPYRDDGNISWPGGGGPTYEVLHPITKKPCKVPDGGWRYSKPETFWEEVQAGNVVFGPDETTLPRQYRELFRGDGQVMPSVQYSYAQTATMDFSELMGSGIFENPKNWVDIKRVIQAVGVEDGIVLDFFAGSSTTAHAVLRLNAQDGKKRKFILVQIPEPIDENTPAYQAGYDVLTKLGRERIRRAARQIEEETKAEIDLGFRVYRLDESNMQDVYYRPSDINQQNLELFADNIKPERTTDDLITQIMLDWGLPLSLPLERLQVLGKEVLQVAGNSLFACFDSGVDEKFAREISAFAPLRIVFRDRSFANDTAKENVRQLIKQLSPSTEMRVL